MSKNPYPMRMCSGCRVSRAKQELIRIVRMEDGKAIIDEACRMPGRGAYICPSEECIAKAEKKNNFARNFKANVNGQIYSDLRKLVKGE